MDDFNLPPGCRLSGIPDNRPSDAALVNWLEKVLDEYDLLPHQVSKVFDLFDSGLSPQEAIERLKEE